MIGLNEDFLLRDGHEEGEDTKTIKKKKLYEMISKDYFLPPIDSKGITREYLLKVRDGEVFRVTNRDYKDFEYHLDKKMQRKVGIVNNALMVRKINMFLQLKGEPPLGFTEFDLPEQNWLYTISRLIDPTNLLEFFEAPATSEPPLTNSSSELSTVYYGRLYASQWLFRLENVRRNKKLFETFEQLSEKHRNLLSLKTNADILEHDLQIAKRNVEDLDRELHDLIGKVSFTYTSIEDPNITPELVISGGSNLTGEMRDRLNLNSKL